MRSWARRQRSIWDRKQVRDLLYIDDLVRAFDLATRNSHRLKGEVFDIGGGSQNTLSLVQLLELLEKLVGERPSARFSRWRLNDQKVYISDIRKAKEIPGWEPIVDLATGVSRLVDRVKLNKSLFR